MRNITHYFLVAGTSRGKIYRQDMRLFSKLADAVEYSKLDGFGKPIFGRPNNVWRIELDGRPGMVICSAKWIRATLDKSG